MGQGLAGDEVLVGLDVGTTACKAAAVSLEGVELVHASRPTPWASVPTGAEIDAGALAEQVIGAAHDALDHLPDRRPVAVGVCSMGETGFLLDRRGDPLGPGIAWHDARGAEHLAPMGASLGYRRFVETTGLPLSSAWTIAKYASRWGHSPEADDGRRWLSVAEWIVRALGGEEAAEPSLASRTGFFDVDALTWWTDALAWAGASNDLMPSIVDSGTPCGTVSASDKLRGAVLTVAGHDHPCAAIGAAATGDGDVLNSCGTAEAVLRAVSPPVPSSDVSRAVRGGLTFGAHVLPGRRALLGFFKAGFALRRFLDLLGVPEIGPGREALDESARRSSPAEVGLEVLDVASDRALLAGIGPHPSPGLVWRAALEAGAHETKAILAAMKEASGTPQRIVVTGGWARSRLFREVKRETIGDFDYPAVAEAGARGAALLAGVAAGVYERIGDVPAPPQEESSTDPDPS